LDYNGTAPVATYTLSDGSSTDTSTLTINVAEVNDASTITNVDSARVSEEGLDNGITDSDGLNAGDDTTDAVVSTGTITVTDPDSDTFTVELTAPIESLFSNGDPVTWAWESTSNILTGSAGGSTVATIEVDPIPTLVGGEYQFSYTTTLLNNLDHPDVTGEDILNFNVGVNVTDGTGSASTASTINIVVEDDSQNSVDDHQSIVIPPQNTNVMLIIDVSGSMDFDSNPDENVFESRLDLLKTSVNELLDQYGKIGDVMVRIVTFATDAQVESAAWLTLTDAKTIINDLEAVGGTNYDAALHTAMLAFGDNGALENATNVSYFMSDGVPTYSDTTPNAGNPGNAYNPDLGDGIDNTEEAEWVTFLNEKGINSLSIGFGGTLTSDAEVLLDPIAHNGAKNLDQDSFIAETPEEFLTQLLTTINVEPFLGSLFGSITTNGFGADGGYFKSIILDGVTYTYDPAANAGVGQITQSNSNNVTSGAVITSITRQDGITGNTGSIVINFATGDYAFTPSRLLPADVPITETLEITLIDGDGDEQTGTVTLNISRALNTVLEPDVKLIDEDNVATGNVITNDSDDDDVLSVVSVNVNGTNYSVPETSITVTDASGSTIGSLTIATDGVYTFTPVENWNGDVPTIFYTVNTGPSSTLDITVNPVADDLPIVTITDEDGEATSADNSVVEATGATVTGNISITAAAGVASLTIAGQDITNASTSPVVIAGDEGTLTVTTYDVASGAVTYSYVEDGNAENHSGGPDSIVDVFAVVLTDTEGDIVTDDLDIQIIDTVPVAENDSNSVSESNDADDQTSTGNVLTGVGVDNTGADNIGADTVAANVTAVSVDPGNSSLKYGTLDLKADGTYTYTLSSTNIDVTSLNNDESLTDSYTYTLTDGDGSTATAILSIVINGADGAPILHGTCMRDGSTTVIVDSTETLTEENNGTFIDNPGSNDRLSINFSDHTSTTNGNSTIGSIATFSATTYGSVDHQGFEHFTINAANGVTTLTTGDGDDIITNLGTLNGANNLTVGAGDNTITTGGGVNLIDFTDGNNTIETGDGANTITGTSGDNYIKTGGGVETITLGSGDNIIKSGDGANTIIATHGDNFVCSGIHVDTITLGDGNNAVLARDGANTVIVGNGVNLVIGGIGVDNLTAGDGGNYIDGGLAGANTIISGSGDDIIFGGIAKDTISAGGGDDIIHILGGGPNTIKGEAGSDTLVVDFSDATATITNSGLGGTLAAGYSGTIGGAGATDYTGIETFDITTGSGADSILTGDGDDILFGGAGNDTLLAGAGNDILTGGEGIDRLTGGTGTDTFVFNSADGTGSTDTITDFSLTEGDVLNFSDFLVGEESGNIADYLSVTTEVVNGITNSTITADSNGGGIGGSDLTVVIQDVDLSALGNNQAEILQSLIDSNNLTVDQL
jgi:VCBS repeat-containing protein